MKSLDQLMVFVPSFTSFLNFTGLRRADFFTVFEKIRDIPESYNSKQVCFLCHQTDGTSTEGKTMKIYTNIKFRASCQLRENKFYKKRILRIDKVIRRIGRSERAL